MHLSHSRRSRPTVLPALLFAFIIASLFVSQAHAVMPGYIVTVNCDDVRPALNCLQCGLGGGTDCCAGADLCIVCDEACTPWTPPQKK
mgnify:CR=1 FL=1